MMIAGKSCFDFWASFYLTKRTPVYAALKEKSGAEMAAQCSPQLGTVLVPIFTFFKEKRLHSGAKIAD